MGIIQHVFSNAQPDGTNTQIVRPSDWNSSHNYTLQDAVSLAGNTAGVMANISSGTLFLAGGANVTLSQNGNSVSISAGTAAAAPLNFSAGASSDNLGSVVFSNSNGVSFGLAGSTITATVATNYQSQGAYLTTAQPVGAYLTTAALSQDSSKYAFTGFTTTTVAGAVVAGTHNTAGLKLAVPAYLTTAQAPGAYLTTAMASDRGSDFVQATAAFAGTNASGTIGSNGISVSVAAPGAGGGVAVQVNALTTYTSGTVVFSNSNGVTFGTNGQTVTATVATNYQSQGAYLTTADLSQNSSLYAATGFTTTTIAGAVVAGTHNTAGLKLAVPAYLTTAQAPGAYLTTARASNDAVGLNTALTANGVAWTVNSSGLSLNVPAFLTTAMASNRGSDFVQATAAFAGTNASGTIASNGISVSVAAPGAAAENNWVNLLGANTSGNTTASGSTLGFSGVNMTLSGTNASQIVMSVPATSSLVGVGGLTVSTAGSTISVSYIPPTLQYFEVDDIEAFGLATNLTALNSTPFFVPFVLKGNLTNNSLIVQLSRSTSGSNAFTLQAGIYTLANVSSANLLGSLQAVFSNTDSGSVSGIRYFVATGWQAAVTNLTHGNYLLGLNFSAGATASMNYSLFGGVTQSGPVGYVFAGSNSANTNNTTWGVVPLWGKYTAASAALPAGVGQSNIVAGWSGASQPMAPWFVLRP